MIKKLFFCMVLMLFGSAARAQDMNESAAEATDGAVGNLTARVTTDDIVLYNFSDALQKSAAGCLPYREDFAAANPDIQKWSGMFGGAKLYADIEVLGQEQGKCHFTVVAGIEGIGGTAFDCHVTKQQLDKLRSAMKSRSTEPITKTIQSGGKGDTLPITTTMTDSLFNVTWAEISSEACETTEQEATQEQQEQAAVQVDRFSSDFVNSLYQCKPFTESKKLLMFTETVEIVGKENNTCHLHYDWFDLYVPTELLANIQSFTDVQRLLQNRDITVYRPEYKYGGLLRGLKECQKNTTYTAGLRRTTKNDVVITDGLTLKKNNDGCKVKLLNQLNIGDDARDYSVECRLSGADLALILQTYQDLLQNDETTKDALEKADAEIMFQMQQAGLCQKPKR